MHEITSSLPPACDFNEVRRVEGFDRIREQYPDFLSDESKLTMGPFDLLFFPANESELSAVVKEMVRRNIPITVAGARTGLVGGCVPPEGALVSLAQMSKVLAVYHAPYAREWRIRAEAAVRLADIDKMAESKRFPDLEKSQDPFVIEQLRLYGGEQQRYFYPPDPTEMSASIGGSVATNASGARTFRFGPTRDWVRGIRVMTMTGEVLDIPRGKYFSSPSGWFTVYDGKGSCYPVRIPDYQMPRTKNTAGFYASPHMDLVDLFIGSEGSFGIITSVDIALLAWQPKCSIILFTESDERALHLVETLRSDKRLKLDFLEFYSSSAMDLLRDMQAGDPRHVGMPAIPESAGAAVFFDVGFDPLEEKPDFRALEESTASAGVYLADSWAGYEPRELARFKAFRHLLPEKITQVLSERKKTYPGLHRLSSDLAVPDEHLFDMWRLYRTQLDQAGFEWVAFGHVGNNHLHVSTMPRNMEELERGLRLYAQFAQKAAAYGGAVSAEHGVGKIKSKFLAKMYSADEINQMHAVKTALDPDMLLNPGNIFAA